MAHSRRSAQLHRLVQQGPAQLLHYGKNIGCRLPYILYQFLAGHLEAKPPKISVHVRVFRLDARRAWVGSSAATVITDGGLSVLRSTPKLHLCLLGCRTGGREAGRPGQPAAPFLPHSDQPLRIPCSQPGHNLAMYVTALEYPRIPRETVVKISKIATYH